MSRSPALHPHPSPRVEFCGIDNVVDRTPYSIGRDGDLVLDDDNRYLHRQFLVLDVQRGAWTLANVGTQLTASVSDQAGKVEAHLAPGGVIALTSAATVRFVAGPTTYELSIHVPTDEFAIPSAASISAGIDATIGRVSLSPEQLLLVVVLAEPVLRNGYYAAASLPSNAAAAERLGWTVTKFNRKLDAVCAKLADRGVRGVHGGSRRLATNRRARRIEHAIAARLVTADDLSLLPGA